MAPAPPPEALTDALSKLRSLLSSKLENQRAPAQLLVAVEQSLDESRPGSSSATDASNRSASEYFLALESMLERATMPDAPPTLLPSTFYILALVSPHVSVTIIKARLSSLLPALLYVLSNPHPPSNNAAESHSALLRSALTITQAVVEIVGRDRNVLQTEPQLRAVWDAALELCADSRPKVRRRAQEVISGIITTDSDGEAAQPGAKPHPYAARTAEWCNQSLRSVIDAGGVKGKGKGKKGINSTALPTYDVKKGKASGAQEAAKQRQNEAAGGAAMGTWVCGFLTSIVTHLPEKFIPQLCEDLLRLPGLQNPFLTVNTFEVFEALYRPPKSSADAVARNLGGSSGNLLAASASTSATKASPPSSLVKTLEALRTLQPSSSDVQLLPPYLRALEGATVALARYEEGAPAWRLFPALWDEVMELSLSARSNASRTSIAVRTAGSETLCSFIRYCIPEGAIREAVQTNSKGSKDALTKTTLGTMIQSIELALSRHALRFTHSRAEVLTVLAALIMKLRVRLSNAQPAQPAATELLLPLVKIVADLRQTPKFEQREQADHVLGAATEVCGPEAILDALPLGLLGENGPGKEGKAWLLPLMRGRITNAPLQHFVREIVPLSEKLFNARAQAEADKGRAVEAKMYEALVEQLWSLFPGYCDMPVDLPAALTQKFAELLSNVLYTQQPLRPNVLRGLVLLVDRNEALSRSGAPSETLLMSFGITAADGKTNIEHLIKLAPAFLSVFSNLLTQSPSSSRGYISEAIGAYLRILPASEVKATYQKVSSLLDTSLKELVPQRDREVGPHAVPPTAHSMLDLMVSLVPFLPVDDGLKLFALAMSPELLENEDAGVQKKTYRILSRLMDGHKGEALLRSGKGTTNQVSELLTKIQAATVNVVPGAKRDRINLLTAIVPRIPLGDLHLLPSIIPEAVLATKEANQGTRETAYELLVQMGDKMQESGGKIKRGLLENEDEDSGMKDDQEVDASLTEYVTMVAAGLAGGSPHMISASITSLSRLLYEYKSDLPRETVEDLISTIEVFLSSPNREIVRSVLGFVKVVIVSLDYEIVDGHLPAMVPAMLNWSPDHRAHFKAKVRHIFERLLRRFGYDRIASLTDEDNRKLVVNIKKRKERAKRKKIGKEAEEQGDEEAGNQATGAPGAKAPKKSLGVDAFEDALYGSESDISDSDDDEDGDPRAVASSLARRAADARNKKGSAADSSKPARRRRKDDEDAYLLEDDDEPMDLLDRSATAAGRIVSQKPGGDDGKKGPRGRRPGQEAGKFELDEKTGRMVINDEDGVASEGDANGAAGDFGSVGAYVEREQGVDGHTHSGRGGAVRFNKNNKRARQQDAEMELEEMAREAEAERAATAASSAGRSKAAAQPSKERPTIGREFKAKKAKGDVKKRDGFDPYAYVSLGQIAGKKAKKRGLEMDMTGRGKK
ncbi:unnamed protein product [Jaminaea pallidilutea]